MAAATALSGLGAARPRMVQLSQPSGKQRPLGIAAVTRGSPETSPGKVQYRERRKGSISEEKQTARRTSQEEQREEDDDKAAAGEPALAPHVEAILSPSNPFVKQAVKLRQSSSYRRAAGKVVVIGATPLLEIARASPLQPAIHILLLLEGTNEAELQGYASRTVMVSPAVMKKVAGVESAEAVNAAGLLSLPVQELSLLHRERPRRVLALEGVQDPGNLGSLLRSAAAFAWDSVLLLPGCCDPFNDKAIRAARGGVFRLPVAAISGWDRLQEFANEAGLVLVAADPAPDGLAPESLSQLEGLCLVLGSEGRGLSEQASSACRRVAIPMPGHFESLNVAVAGGILLHLLNPKQCQTLKNVVG